MSCPGQITISVSNGSKIRMPNLVGQQPQAAIQQLRELGLAGQVEQQQDREVPEAQENLVTEQSADPGELIDPDDDITLVFGNPPGGVNG